MKKKVSKNVKRTATIFSRHPTHDVLRNKIVVPVSTVVRLGSTTESIARVQINSIEAIQNSSDKKRMKEKFAEMGVPTPPFVSNIKNFFVNEKDNVIQWQELGGDTTSLKFPIVLKHRYGSRGTGNTLFRSASEFNKFVSENKQKDWDKYIIEEYVPYLLEYRLHVSPSLGCFYTCRKALKKDAPEEAKWFRNDSNSVWIMEENPEFFKPENWEEIVEACVAACVAVGLDFSAIDCRVSQKKDSEGNQRFVIIETNSAPSFGEVTSVKYLEALPKIIQSKL